MVSIINKFWYIDTGLVVYKIILRFFLMFLKTELLGCLLSIQTEGLDSVWSTQKKNKQNIDKGKTRVMGVFSVLHMRESIRQCLPTLPWLVSPLNKTDGIVRLLICLRKAKKPIYRMHSNHSQDMVVHVWNQSLSSQHIWGPSFICKIMNHLLPFS